MRTSSFVVGILVLTAASVLAAGCSSNTDDNYNLASAIGDGTLGSIVHSTCDTAGAEGISKQLFEMVKCEMPEMWTDVSSIDGLALNDRPAKNLPFLRKEAADALKEAIQDYRAEHPNSKPFRLNVAYRSLAQQYILAKLHTIPILDANGKQTKTKDGDPSWVCQTTASVGGSNHGGGVALDTQEMQTWQTVLAQHKFDWFGTKDKVHYTFRGPEDRAASVRAFQRLWNANHPEAPITVTGLYDEATKERLPRSPAAGFPIVPPCQSMITHYAPSALNVALNPGEAYEVLVTGVQGAQLIVENAATASPTNHDIEYAVKSTGAQERVTVSAQANSHVTYKFSITGPGGGELACAPTTLEGDGTVECTTGGKNKRTSVATLRFKKRAALPDAPGATITDATAASVACPAFKMADLKDPSTGGELQPGATVTVKDETGEIWSGTSEQLLEIVNKAQLDYCAKGSDLTKKDDFDLVDLVRNNEIFAAEKQDAYGLLGGVDSSKVRPALKNCPLVTLLDLVKAGTAPPQKLQTQRVMEEDTASGDDPPYDAGNGLASTLVTLADGTRMRAGALRERLNQQQCALCEIGYDFVSGVQRGTDAALAGFLQRRSEVMGELGLSELSRLWNLASSAEAKSFVDLAHELQEAAKDPEAYARQKLSDWTTDTAKELRAEWQIPDIPNEPMPVLEKRKDLSLLKRKVWNGFDVGNHGVAAIHSNAWYEVRGDEVGPSGGPELDARGQGLAGAYILNRHLNIVDASGVFSASKDEVSGYLTVKAIGGGSLIDTKFNQKTSYSFTDRPWDFADSVEYTQEFSVGPIPVVVKAAFDYSFYLSYEVGANLTKVYGKIVPGAQATLRFQGGIGTRVVSAGCAGVINVIDASVPLEGSAGLAFEEHLPVLKLNVKGDFLYSYLDGRAEAYAEWPWLKCSLDKGCRWTRKRATRELFAWDGEHGRRPVLNWGMELRPFGVRMTGDLIDQTDRDELAQLRAVADLEKLKAAVNDARTKVVAKENAVFGAIDTDFAGASQTALLGQAGALQKALRDLDDKTNGVITAAQAAAGP